MAIGGTYSAEIEAMGGDGEGNRREEGGELGPEEYLLEVGQQPPEGLASHFGQHRPIRPPSKQ